MSQPIYSEWRVVSQSVKGGEKVSEMEFGFAIPPVYSCLRASTGLSREARSAG